MGVLGSIRRVWFASRKVRLPIPKSALVLEVGSGDSPCPRSDVLFDLTLSNHERVGGRTVNDRPLVLGLAERLPFRDKAFDFVIAFHILEHSPDPRAFLEELQRVASAGYIETPSFWAERLIPMEMHRLEVGMDVHEGKNRLLINQKAAPVPDQTLSLQFSPLLVRGTGFSRLSPSVWVTRYFWKESINYKIINPEIKIEWEPPPTVTRPDFKDPRPLVRRVLKRAAQKIHRPKEIDLVKLLRCVDCDSDNLQGGLQSDRLWCSHCGRYFRVTGGVPCMHPAGCERDGS